MLLFEAHAAVEFVRHFENFEAQVTLKVTRVIEKSTHDALSMLAALSAVACELANAWRVFFEYRMKPGESLATMPNTNPPNYVIDKRTGQIIYTTHKIAR